MDNSTYNHPAGSHTSLLAKTILITGCSSGFGRATTLHLLQHGWQVFATIRNEADRDALMQAATETKGNGRLIPFVCDVTQSEQLAKIAQEVASFTQGLDVLLNNAGIDCPAPLELISLDEMRTILEVNLVAPLATTQTFLPLLRNAKGMIINVSSGSGRVALPVVGAYSASKFGLEGLSDTLRLELSPFGVRVIVVQPGSSSTNIQNKALRNFETIITRDPVKAAPYKSLINTFKTMANKGAKGSFPPEQFADLILKIINTRNPHPRYVLPASVSIIIAIRQILPDRLWDSLAHKMFAS